MRIRLKENCTLLIAVVALGSFFAASVRADEPLRWKFKVGEKLHFTIVTEMPGLASGPAVPQELKNSTQEEMKLTWDVQGVDDKSGEAVIRVKFDHAKVRMKSPLGTSDYDSASEEVPAGPAAMMAPIYKALVDGGLELTITSRGEVKDVKVPEQVRTALNNLPNAAELGDLASVEGFKKMQSQGILVLPKDAPKKGETWTAKVESQIPVAGKQTAEMTYRYEGTKDVGGTTFAVIKSQRKIDFENQPAEKAVPPKQPAAQPHLQWKVKEQTSDGETLFDIAAGRLHSTSLTHHLVIEGIENGQPIQEQKFDQKINVTVAREKTAGEAKKSGASGEKAAKADK